MPINHENALKAPLGKYLRARGYQTHYEFPVGNRTIDVIAWNETGRIVAVELKIQNWLRGLQQASFYAGWSDAAYLAMPVERSKAAQKNVALFDSIGVGLLVVEKGQCREVIPPQLRHFNHMGADRIAVQTALALEDA